MSQHPTQNQMNPTKKPETIRTGGRVSDDRRVVQRGEQRTAQRDDRRVVQRDEQRTAQRDDRRAALRRAEMERKKIEKRKRRKKNLITGTVFTVVVAGIMCFILLHMSSDKEELREQGIAAYQSGSYSEAVGFFLDSLEEEQWFTEDMDLDTRLYLGNSYMQMNDYTDANSVYVEVRSLNDGQYDEAYIDSLVGVSSAMVEVERGNYETAAAYLSDEVNKGNTALNLYLGACYGKQGDYETMMQCFQNYLAAYPLNTYLAYQISTYYLNSGDYESAKSYLDNGAACNDDVYREMLLYNEIVYYEKILDYQTAYNKAEAFVSSYPENEAGQTEYDFLNTRININPEPVHKEEPENAESTGTDNGE